MNIPIKKRVLVVDDDTVIRMLLHETLSDLGYTVDAAENGHKALQKFKCNTYDLIISDVMMPEMDGINLYHKIREDFFGLEKKILFITGNPSNEVLLFFQENNLYYITKPFAISDLLNHMDYMFANDALCQRHLK